MKSFNKLTTVYCVSFILILSVSSVCYSQTIKNGTYKQTSVSGLGWGDCATCNITIENVTPDIIKIISNNGWIGFAVYDIKEDKYNGAWQWKKEHPWNGHIFDCSIFQDGRVINLIGTHRNSGEKYSITYRKDK